MLTKIANRALRAKAKESEEKGRKGGVVHETSLSGPILKLFGIQKPLRDIEGNLRKATITSETP